MKYLPGFLIVAILTGCLGSTSSGPLRTQDSFTLDGKNYMVSVLSEPETPEGDKPFTLRIELNTPQTHETVKHITYELEITDSSGRNVFWDSRHVMEGAPYMRKVTLKPGEYTLRVVIDHGMGDKIMKLYETELRFRVV
jgi:hypothetical protein